MAKRRREWKKNVSGWKKTLLATEKNSLSRNTSMTFGIRTEKTNPSRAITKRSMCATNSLFLNQLIDQLKWKNEPKFRYLWRFECSWTGLTTSRWNRQRRVRSWKRGKMLDFFSLCLNRSWLRFSHFGRNVHGAAASFEGRVSAEENTDIEKSFLSLFPLTFDRKHLLAVLLISYMGFGCRGNVGDRIHRETIAFPLMHSLRYHDCARRRYELLPSVLRKTSGLHVIF